VQGKDHLKVWLRRHISYANVVATLALFAAVAGTSYAALRIGSREITNNSVRSVDIRNNGILSKDVRDRGLRGRDVSRNGLGGGAIKESALGRVPDAAQLDGRPAFEYRLRCPPGTVSKAGVCIESSPRSPVPFPSAIGTCSDAGRRLPDYAVLKRTGEENGPLSPTPEWTSSVYEGAPGELKVVLVTSNGGEDFGPALTPTTRPFRCMALPSN
jgi:hypothetical protein